MTSPPWMPLDIDDYLADTAHLSLIEHGAYMLLIMRYWKDGGLPSDERMIARYSRLTPEQWADSRDVLAAFFVDGWRHKRIDAELAKAAEIIGKRKAAAEQRHANSPSRAEHGKDDSGANAVHVHSTSTHTGVPPSHSPEPSSLRSEGKRAKRAARLPADWVLPIEWRQDAIDAGIQPERIDAEATEMRDWSLSSPNGAKLDWHATWRTWCRRRAEERPTSRGSPPQKPPSLADAFGRVAELAEYRSDARRSENFGSVQPALPHLSRVSDGRS